MLWKPPSFNFNLYFKGMEKLLCERSEKSRRKNETEKSSQGKNQFCGANNENCRSNVEGVKEGTCKSPREQII